MSVNTEIDPVLSEFVADMTLLPFNHGRSGPTRVSAQGFVGVLDFFLSRRVSLEIGTVRVENESVFPSDHYPVRLCLHTLPALVPCGNRASKARFNLGTSVCNWQQETFAHSCASLHSLPRGYRDDTTWCIDSESDLPLFADNLQRAAPKMNLNFLLRP